MSKTNKGIVDFVKTKLGISYVYGAKMEILTKQKYDWLKRTYGKMVWDSDVSKIGKMCCDCSGLISAYTGIAQGSSQMKSSATECKPISTIATAPIGAILWQNGHVGVYIGNGEYIAEDGSKYGCRKNLLSKSKFTHWLKLPSINYSEPEIEQDNFKVYNCKELNVRIGAGSDYRLVTGAGTIKINDVVEITEIKDGWGKHNKGWSSMSFLIKSR